ncbi:hypothetical protein ON010_g7988 [Phytophthora cinnamomi]|nr:hypothetical protein ON010_g7988 [Phytophthora cinnamomi]
MLDGNFEGVVLSFDGAAKTSTRKGSCGCILWRLPGWDILDVQGFILNDAEYHGLLNGLTMALLRGVKDLIVVGDSRIVVQQVEGLINCNQPNLQRYQAMCKTLEARFNVDPGYVMECRRCGRADAPAASVEDSREADETCRSVERPVIPDEILLDPESAPLPPAARVMAVLTRAATKRQTESAAPMGPLAFQAERWRRIKAHQDQDDYLVELKAGVRYRHPVVRALMSWKQLLVNALRQVCDALLDNLEPDPLNACWFTPVQDHELLGHRVWSAIGLRLGLVIQDPVADLGWVDPDAWFILHGVRGTGLLECFELGRPLNGRSITQTLALSLLVCIHLQVERHPMTREPEPQHIPIHEVDHVVQAHPGFHHPGRPNVEQEPSIPTPKHLVARP